MGALDELTKLAGDITNPAVEEWKASGKRAVGFFCSYVPEEILYAGGILPCRMRAPGCAVTTEADVYLSHLNCTYMRACLQYALDGRYRHLDGLAFTNSCDHVRRVYDILREIRPGDYPLMHMISVPHKSDEDLIAWFGEELGEFKGIIESTFGVEITEAGLRDAIAVYNDSRELLKRLYDLRKGEKPPISGAEALKVILAGYSLPRDRYNELLRQLLEELESREGISGYRARLMIAGSGGFDDPAYIEVMEVLGGLVVTDSLCFGSRGFWEPVQEDGDPLLAIARAYLKRPSCPRMVDEVALRCDFVKRMVADFNVDGVVFQRMRYCDLWGGQLLYLEKELSESGIPMLSLEREYAMGGAEQLRTRVQAFLERIEG
jgi:benzoyl-CoA reductase subunit C